MRVDELFRSGELSYDDIIRRVQNSKSKEEKEKWSSQLVNHRISLAEESLEQYSKRLVSSLKIKRLGSGAFAHVFQHPVYHNVAVKVFAGHDKLYQRYMNWALKNQGNPYVPQIVSISKQKAANGETYTIVFMQKMERVSEEEFKKWYVKSFGKDSYNAFTEDDFDSQFEEADEFIQRSKDQKLKDLWAHLKTYGRSKFDLHPGNVMKRGSQIVITDPVGFVDDHMERVDDQSL